MTNETVEQRIKLLKELSNNFSKFNGKLNSQSNKQELESLTYKMLHDPQYACLNLRIVGNVIENWQSMMIASDGEPIIIIRREPNNVGKLLVNTAGVDLLFIKKIDVNSMETLQELLEVLIDEYKSLPDDIKPKSPDVKPQRTSSLFNDHKIDPTLLKPEFKSEPFNVKPKPKFYCKTCNAEYDNESYAERCYNEGHYDELTIIGVKFKPKDTVPNEVTVALSGAPGNARKCTYVLKEDNLNGR